MADTMRAVVLTEHGDLDKLSLREEHPRPRAEPGEVVVKVGATSFNYHDVFTMRGMPGIRVPLPIVIGLDIAGEVEETGEGIEGWRPGDRVLVHPHHPRRGLMGETLDGGLAQYVMVSAEQLIALPDKVSFTDAAALPVAYGTAHRMIVDKETVRAGDSVLVLGASGGVGTASVILAKKLGAEVIAAVGSAEKARRMLELGADHVIDYRETDFLQWVKDRYGKPRRHGYDGGVDVVVNYTGGDTWAPTLRAVKRGGKILVCGATAGFDPPEDLRYIWTFELQVVGSNGFTAEDFRALLAGVAAGEFAPVVDDVLPLSKAHEGLRRLRDREVIGKVVVDPWLEG
ncbi:zinc-binding dehydrogenase [Actinomadura vinacea]|uniref:Zinc-binding dehydrogenase n=1 Tax=Actinomadura vinacea TaxID=115336 RepID=A0ABP5WZA1_9ACTN